MGQPMPKVEIEYGVDCLAGWDAGKTPKYLYARFSKIVQCPDLPAGKAYIPPNDHAFTLTQVEDVPCRWVYERSPWYVQFTVSPDPAEATFYIRNMLSGTWYFSARPSCPPGEGEVYHSTYFTCTTYVWGIEGIGVVTWTPQATELLKSINMEKAADLFMELFPLPDGKLVYKFCRLQDATNISILFEP